MTHCLTTGARSDHTRLPDDESMRELVWCLQTGRVPPCHPFVQHPRPHAGKSSVLLINPACSPLFVARIKTLLLEGTTLQLVFWDGADGDEVQLEQAVRAALR